MAALFALTGSATGQDPIVCKSTIDSRTRELTPELAVIKIVDTRSCGATIRIGASDPSGALWATDNGSGVWTSMDDGDTWILAYKASAYGETQDVLPLESGALLLLVQDGNGIRHLVRVSPDRTSSADVLDFPAGAWLLGSQSWVETPEGVFAAEYGSSGLPQLSVWRSSDDANDFSPVFVIQNGSGFGIRHFHSVQADPYAPGTIWLTAGDVSYQPRIGYSVDGGSSFTWITQGQPPESRAVSLMFTSDAVYWATDSPGGPASVYRWDRVTHVITQVATGFNGPFYFTVSFRGLMAAFSAVELPQNGYTGDQWVHVMSSSDGQSWNTAAGWMRMQDPGVIAWPSGITPPDSEGRFWVAYYGLDGTPDRTVNVEFQISPANLRVVVGTATVLNRRRRTLSVFIACPQEAPDGWCRGRVTVRLPGEAASSLDGLASQAYVVKAGTTQRILVPMAISAVGALSGAHASELEVTAVTTDRLGRSATATTTASLLRR